MVARCSAAHWYLPRHLSAEHPKIRQFPSTPSCFNTLSLMYRCLYSRIGPGHSRLVLCEEVSSNISEIGGVSCRCKSTVAAQPDQSSVNGWEAAGQASSDTDLSRNDNAARQPDMSRDEHSSMRRLVYARSFALSFSYVSVSKMSRYSVSGFDTRAVIEQVRRSQHFSGTFLAPRPWCSRRSTIHQA